MAVTDSTEFSWPRYLAMDLQGFKSLAAWQRARTLAVDVVTTTSSPAFRTDWALRDQLRRAAVSVASNIAEGSERGSNPDTIRFFNIARGSLAELYTQADIACEVGLLSADARDKWLDETDHIARMLLKLIRARSARSPIRSK